MENYTVKKGDTLEYISNLYNIPPVQIVKANNLVPPYYLQEGQVLTIPLGNYDIFDYYVIQKGDTLYQIANKNNVAVDVLASINGINANEYIYPGQTLLVPKSNIKTYITKMGDSLNGVAVALRTNPQELILNNRDIYLLPDQLLVYREK